MQRSSITIVGASLAGLRAIEALRRGGFEGDITLIGDEPHTPYDRPPLSKKVLSGEWPLSKPVLATAERLAELDVDAHIGVRATGFHLANRRLSTTKGEIDVDGLLIATGARCRTIPGTEDLDGVHVLRTLDDCSKLRTALESTTGRVVVVGAGFIGAEVAATCRGLERDVTLVEALPTPLGRILGDTMGEVMAQIHTEHGVDLRTGVGVDEISSAAGKATGVVLSDGSSVDADIIVVGIGVTPNTEWLEGSGLTIDNGIVCDETTLAAPGVTAAGDVARWPNPRFGGEMMRVEHWDNAVSMGMHAAQRLLVDDAEATAYDPVPWFWSDQYDRKIQLAGRVRPDDHIEIVEGTLEERRFVALYGRGENLAGVFGMNRPRHVMQYKMLMDQGASFADALAAEI